MLLAACMYGDNGSTLAALCHHTCDFCQQGSLMRIRNNSMSTLMIEHMNLLLKPLWFSGDFWVTRVVVPKLLLLLYRAIEMENLYNE